MSQEALEDGEAIAPRPRAPTRRFERRRSAIIASAVEELNRKGIRGMTLGEVAARLDLVPTGVIYYFRNKEELASACFLQALQRFEGLIGEARGAADPREAILRFLALFFELKHQAAVGAADQIAVFNDVRALNAPAVNDAYVTMFRSARRLLDRPGGPRLPPLQRNARAHLLLSEAFWAVAWLRDFEPVDYARAADRAGSILLDGVAAPGTPWPRARKLDLTHANDPRADASSELFLRAATELINAEGYHGASVERISAKLNVSKGAFYHHNETKDELVAACFQRTFDVMWRAIRAAEAGGGSGLEVLVSAATALVEHQWGGASPLLRTSALTTVPESMQPELIRRFDRLSLRFASVLCDGVADGSVRPLDVSVGAQMITGMINAAAELQFWAPGLTTGNVADHYVRPFFTGLLIDA
ncbi:TetR/AcrR family transcriptional regulator [Phenylobacterium sp.]|uniref:TetR/AcrR family transcriptional regulator n=1 Tax=Phenylobacterium sp. TaxID=1871053 RepID=UPI002DF52867|nr:TetR family transcriptional regulator [Phenylobacterium sp.]